MERQRFQFGLKSLLIAPAVMVAALYFLNGLRIVGIHYPRAYQNDPLTSPIKVAVVDASHIQLADGRTIAIRNVLSEDPLPAAVLASGDNVDLEIDIDGRHVVIFGKVRGWICGTPWA